MDDAISRQAAIDANCYNCSIKTNGGKCSKCDAVKAIEKLPSVNPQPCEDAISRNTVYELSKELIHITRYKADFLCKFRERLHELPSVKPQEKMGHWILADEQNKEDVENDNYRFICSECQCSDIHAKGTIVPYCWNCGRRMFELQEGSDKE